MTLRFIESFDDRTTANAAFKWGSTQSTVTLGTSYGRYGQGWYVSSDGNLQLNYNADTAQNTWIVGFALKSELGYFYTHSFIRFIDVATTHCYLRIDPDNRIRIYNENGTLLLTSTLFLIPKCWQYIELKIKFDNAAGTVDLRINGVSAGSVTGVDTTNTGNAYITQISYRGGGSGYFLDDMYICDGAGADTFRGDCRVETLLPSGAGNYTAWTPSAGSNYQNVDDAYASAPCPDGDTTYNSSTTPGNRDSFAYGNLVITSGTILGVQVSPNVTKTDAGARSIKSFTRLASTDYDGAAKSVGGSYASYPELWLLNPNTSAAWTIANVNTDAEFGIKDEA